jgi:hypothetical protein
MREGDWFANRRAPLSERSWPASAGKALRWKCVLLRHLVCNVAVAEGIAHDGSNHSCHHVRRRGNPAVAGLAREHAETVRPPWSDRGRRSNRCLRAFWIQSCLRARS